MCNFDFSQKNRSMELMSGVASGSILEKEIHNIKKL